MKKRYLLVSLLASSFVMGLTSCAEAEGVKTDTAPTETQTANVSVSSITLSGQPKLFKKGSTFNSTGLKVTATMSNGTTKDVTSEAKVEQSAKMDEVGEYEVKVSYSGKTATYKISVLNPTGLSLDFANAKKDYNRLDELSLEGLKAALTYPTGLENTEVDLDDAKVEVKINDALDNELKKLGKHTVYVAVGEFIASYDINVNVEKIDANASIDDLIEIANKYGYLATGGVYSDNPEKNYSYAKGDNLLVVTSEDTLLDSDDVTNVECNTNSYYTTYNNKPMGYTLSTAKDDGRTIKLIMSKGSVLGKDDVNILGNDNPVYGPEDALVKILDLYNQRAENERTFVKNGEANSNGLHESYTITLDVENFDDADRREVRQITCNFVLSDTLYIERLEVNGTYYTEMEKDETTGEYPDLSTVTPHKIKVVYTQDDGEREAVMPYTIDELAVSSYKLKYGEESIENLGTLNLNLGDTEILEFTDIKSDKASLSFDTPEFVVESDDPLVPPAIPENELMFVQASNKVIVTGYKIGEEEITIKTLNFTFKFTINVIAPEPSKIEPMYVDSSDPKWIQLYNISDIFECELNKDIVLYGYTEYGTDSRYEVELLDSVDPNNATLVESVTKFDGANNKTYTFNAKVKGEYRLKFTSIKNPEINTIITIKAGEKAVVENLPQELLGEWVSNISTVYVGETEVTYDGTTQKITEYIEGESFKTNEWSFVINADNTLSFDDGMSIQTLKRDGAEAITELPVDLVGSYGSLNNPEDVITVTPTSITIAGKTYEFKNIELVDGSYTVRFGEGDSIDFIFNDVEGHYFNYKNDMYGIDPATFPVVIVEDKYLGSFELVDNALGLVIEDKFVTVNGTTQRVIDYMADGYIKTRDYTVRLDGDKVVSVDDGEGVYNVVEDVIIDSLPEDVLGVYENLENAELTITVEANKITVDGKAYDITKIVAKNTVYVISYGENLEIEIDFESNPIIIYDGGMYKLPAPALTELPAEVCGTYYNEKGDGTFITINATSITINEATYDFTEILDDGYSYSITFNGQTLTIGYDVSIETYYASYGSDYYDLTEAPLPAVDIDDKYVGNYEIDGIFEPIEIKKNSVVYNYDEQNIIEYVSDTSFKTKTLSFVIKADGKIYLVNDNGEYVLNKLEAVTELPENIIGEYVGEYDDTLTLTVNATSIVLNGEAFDILEIAPDLSYFTYNNGQKTRKVFISNWDGISLRDGQTGFIPKNDTPVEITLADNYIGTWEALFGSDLVITATDVTYEDVTQAVVYYSEPDKSFSTDTWSFVLNDNGTLTLFQGMNEVVFTKVEQAVTVPADFIGNYVNDYNPEDKFEVTATQFIFSADKIYDVVEVTEYDIIYFDGTKNVTVGMTAYANGDFCLGIGANAYTKQVEVIPAVDIDEIYVGTWEGQFSTVIIYINCVDVDGDLEDIIEYNSGVSFKTKSYAFIINSDESLTLVTDTMNQDLAPQAAAELLPLDAQFCGTYVNQIDKTTTIEFTATELIVGENKYAYTEVGTPDDPYLMYETSLGTMVVEFTALEDGSISIYYDNEMYLLAK